MKTKHGSCGGARIAVAGVVALALWAGTARAASNEWSGAGGDDNWTTAGNWAGGAIPANDGTTSIRFKGADNGGTAVVDCNNLAAPSNIWHVGLFEIINPTGSSAYTNFHDLNGQVLAVDSGDVRVAYGSADSSWAAGIFTNGTLQVGMPTRYRNISIGNGNNAALGLLKLAPGTTLNAYLDTLGFGSGQGGGGILDLRGATIAGGVLTMTNLSICTAGNGGIPVRTMHIYMDAATSLSEIRVLRNFDYAVNQMYNVRMGDPANGYKLPTNLCITIGSPTVRGRFYMATAPYSSASSTARLIADYGGQFIAYVTDVLIHPGYFGTGTPDTYFDIVGMTNAVIDDTGEFSVGKNNSSNQMGYQTRVKLCRGWVRCSRLILGTSPVAGSLALLELNATDFMVTNSPCGTTNSAFIGANGAVSNNVNGYSGGLDLTSNATVSVTTGGKIRIQFTADQDPGDPHGVYWGMRWAGDHRADLASMRSATQLVMTCTVGGKSPGFVYNADSNLTYVTIQSSWPPTAVARNLNLEILPPTYSNVVFGVDDIDAGSFDPNGAPLTNRSIACAANLTPSQPFVTLDTIGAYTVWLTVVNSNGVAGSNSCTVTVAAPSAGTGSSLTWDGGATLSLMTRQEWFWDNNWVGDVAPSNPTLGAITFGDTGRGVNRVETNRTIGGLTVNNTAGTNIFDLVGGRLTVRGATDVSPVHHGAGNNWAAAVFTNGTLQVGTPSAPQNLTIGLDPAGSPYYSGYMKVAAGSTFEGYIKRLGIGVDGAAGRGTLDLRGATVAGGVLRAGQLVMADLGWGGAPNRPCEIRLDNATAITGIEITNTCDMGVNQCNTCWIGDPANNTNLPPGVNFKVGVNTAGRGRIRLAMDAYYNLLGRIVATTNGTFTGYLTELTVGGMSWQDLSDALLDVSAMTNLVLDCSGTVGVPGGDSSLSRYNARLKLPPGTGITKDVRIGVPTNMNSSALLQLRSTVLTVTNLATVGIRGTVSNVVDGASGGLDIASTASLVVSNGGKITIVFKQARVLDSNNVYWGLRLAGNQVAALQTLQSDGKLGWNDAAMAPRVAEIFFYRGYTYVGQIYAPKGTIMVVR